MAAPSRRAPVVVYRSRRDLVRLMRTCPAAPGVTRRAPFSTGSAAPIHTRTDAGCFANTKFKRGIESNRISEVRWPYPPIGKLVVVGFQVHFSTCSKFRFKRNKAARFSVVSKPGSAQVATSFTSARRVSNRQTWYCNIPLRQWLPLHPGSTCAAPTMRHPPTRSSRGPRSGARLPRRRPRRC